MTDEIKMMTTRTIEKLIAENQEIQKRNPPSSDEWKAASEELTQLFAEMYRRTGEGRA